MPLGNPARQRDLKGTLSSSEPGSVRTLVGERLGGQAIQVVDLPVQLFLLCDHLLTHTLILPSRLRENVSCWNLSLDNL